MWYFKVPKPNMPEYAYHQIIWSYFADQYPSQRRFFVYRVCNHDIMVLSQHKPNTACRWVHRDLYAGRVYQFDLICSPVRSLARCPDNPNFRMKVPYESNDERKKWLQRRLGDSAELVFSQVFDMTDLVIKSPKNRKPIRWAQCEIKGSLLVKDKMEFTSILCRGVGGRGAWGHGLLHIPEVMS